MQSWVVFFPRTFSKEIGDVNVRQCRQRPLSWFGSFAYLTFSTVTFIYSLSLCCFLFSFPWNQFLIRFSMPVTRRLWLCVSLAERACLASKKASIQLAQTGNDERGFGWRRIVQLCIGIMLIKLTKWWVPTDTLSLSLSLLASNNSRIYLLRVISAWRLHSRR